MKLYLTLIVLFISVITLGVVTINSLSASTEDITKNFSRISASINAKDWTSAEKEFSRTRQQWNRHKEWWAMVINHQEIDNIDTSFARTGAYINFHNQDLSAGELSVLREYLTHIPETEKVNLKNIL